jgi:hypothetical protein
MRTTLTLDRDVAARLRSEMRRTGRGLKAIVNEALRRGLGGLARPGKRHRFVVKTYDLGLRPGIDPNRLNQLVDEFQGAEETKKYRP